MIKVLQNLFIFYKSFLILLRMGISGFSVMMASWNGSFQGHRLTDVYCDVTLYILYYIVSLSYIAPSI